MYFYLSWWDRCICTESWGDETKRERERSYSLVHSLNTLLSIVGVGLGPSWEKGTHFRSSTLGTSKQLLQFLSSASRIFICRKFCYCVLSNWPNIYSKWTVFQWYYFQTQSSLSSENSKIPDCDLICNAF